MDKKIIGILSRYLLLLILSFGNLFLFYFVFTLPTLYLSYIPFHLLANASLGPDASFSMGNTSINLIGACIAGSAYYLLTILNLTTPMPLKKRVKSLMFLLISFLILNVLRVILFSYLAMERFGYFDITHKLVWYFGSTALVILLWFSNVYLFKIKEIPVYSDLKSIIGSISNKHREKKSTKQKRY